MAIHAAEDATWIEVQHRTFTLWLNTQLAQRPEIEPARDVVSGLGDGIRLIQLLEIISDEPLGKFNKNPRLRVQKAENVNVALDFIRSKHIPLTNIGAEDIIDGNLKLMCGLLWTLILRFTIADINVDGLTAKEGLLLWCQRKTTDYRDVDVRNFTSSWANGLAFCALLHRYRPDLLDYYELDRADVEGNTRLAIDLAEEHIGIPKLLSVDDICGVVQPDERAVMTYLAQWFHALSHLDKVETAGRRVEKFADTLRSAWVMRHDYEQRMNALIQGIKDIIVTWNKSKLTNSYDDVKGESLAFSEYKNGIKRKWIREKLALESLLGNIQTKLKTYGLMSYTPPDGSRLLDLDIHWQGLLQEEATRSKTINSKIREIKEGLRQTYAQQANDFATMLQTLSTHLTTLEGELESQLETATHLVEHIEPLQYVLKDLQQAATACTKANVEENDHTIYSYDDMEYEFKLAKESIVKKHKFIENQIVARSKSNITPGQLEEIDSVFRHFDKSGTNTLQGSEFPAALASLGLTYDDAELNGILERIARADNSVTWNSFLNFMIEELEDQNTPEQVLTAFKDVADGKHYITEVDLRESQIPDVAVEYLVTNMPQSANDKSESTTTNAEEAGFDYVQFMSILLFDQD